jgi:hypothetical protein
MKSFLSIFLRNVGFDGKKIDFREYAERQRMFERKEDSITVYG